MLIELAVTNMVGPLDCDIVVVWPFQILASYSKCSPRALYQMGMWGKKKIKGLTLTFNLV